MHPALVKAARGIWPRVALLLLLSAVRVASEPEPPQAAEAEDAQATAPFVCVLRRLEQPENKIQKKLDIRYIVL